MAGERGGERMNGVKNYVSQYIVVGECGCEPLESCCVAFCGMWWRDKEWC